MMFRAISTAISLPRIRLTQYLNQLQCPNLAAMNDLTEGPYQLRYIAPDNASRAIDGLFATRIDGEGNPVIVGPRVASLLEAENWWLERTPNKRSWHILGEGPLPTLENHGALKLGFSHSETKQEVPVVVSGVLKEYTIKLLDNGEYAISVVPTDRGDNWAGTEYMVGVSDKGTLEIQEIKAWLDGQPAAPRWRIQSVE